MAFLHRDNEELGKYIRKCASLANLPRKSTEEGWLQIMQISSQNALIECFKDYFVEQWLEKYIVQYL